MRLCVVLIIAVLAMAGDAGASATIEGVVSLPPAAAAPTPPSVGVSTVTCRRSCSTATTRQRADLQQGEQLVAAQLTVKI
jgi:hypothetical protein